MPVTSPCGLLVGVLALFAGLVCVEAQPEPVSTTDLYYYYYYYDDTSASATTATTSAYAEQQQQQQQEVQQQQPPGDVGLGPLLLTTVVGCCASYALGRGARSKSSPGADAGLQAPAAPNADLQAQVWQLQAQLHWLSWHYSNCENCAHCCDAKAWWLDCNDASWQVPSDEVSERTAFTAPPGLEPPSVESAPGNCGIFGDAGGNADFKFERHSLPPIALAEAPGAGTFAPGDWAAVTEASQHGARRADAGGDDIAWRESMRAVAAEFGGDAPDLSDNSDTSDSAEEHTYEQDTRRYWLAPGYDPSEAEDSDGSCPGYDELDELADLGY